MAAELLGGDYDLRKTDKIMILSPAEDFSSRTLAAVSGLLSKLEYVSGLRTSKGKYAHWGLSRTYGEAAANQTVAQAHTELFVEVLRTPLSKLTKEVDQMAQERGKSAREVIHSLAETGASLIPQSLRGGSERHFNSVLQSLSALVSAQEPRHSRAASPRPRPAR